MKNLYVLFLVMFGATLISISQPTITSSINPSIGDGVSSFEVDTIGVQQGAAGANVTWNFSSINVNLNNPEVITYINPSGTPYSSQFPEANLASNQEGGMYDYFKTESNKLSNLGYASTDMTMIYSDPQQMMAYPFTFNSQFTDDFEGSGMTGASTIEDIGALECNGDAWGTLILPSGTHNNVLRIKTTMVFTSTFSGIATATITIHSYSWYDGEVFYPLMSLTYYTTEIMGNVTKGKDVMVSGPYNSVVDNFASQVSLNLYPNPVVSDCNVSFNLQNNSKVAFSVVDVNGSEIELYQKDMETSGLKNLTFSLSDLTPGAYIARLRIGDRFVDRKFLVQ